MERHFTVTDSGARICLHKVAAEGFCNATVILAHGMFSNYRTCRGLAKYLSTRNFDCWLVDSTGHGYSDKPLTQPDFEAVCLHDTGAALSFVQERSNTPVLWVGHSGGGLAILMYLARNPMQQKQLSGIVTVASQASGAGYNWRRRLMFRCSRPLVQLLGFVPGKALKLGPENEYAGVMDQWLGWSITQRWFGADGFDYESGVSSIQLPVLSIAGSADKTIAPVSGCKALHNALGSTDKTFLSMGLRAGGLEDYSHARVVSSRNAATDVWPIVSDWLKRQSNSAPDNIT